ncbi:hypothetical protein [Caballeronia sp. INDeC2]|uniref:hypothetical protein n=1 Tax=Caballeronia sp. INDeC2 TaxID=2921747 RepID=UPI0020288320|nr:hypothetical protein [Caballeronia sp. INDeC2]
MKAKAWVVFDRIVAVAAPGGTHSNPWVINNEGQLCFEPDYDTLAKLLGVPLFLKAETQSGVPALALDVWLSYELRRAGFTNDEVWPRPVHPRILPAPVASLLASLPRSLRDPLADRVSTQASIAGVTASSASILGKNYLKQVDVIITDWATGPELLISTKRMDSSYGKNAPNRIEESYGDAKNLRLRHPLAALGFVFGLRSDILQKEPATAEWLFDLLAKLGREDDAYHATCLVLMEYSDAAALPDTGEEPPPVGVPEPGPEPEKEEDAPAPTQVSEADRQIAQLPRVTILEGNTPDDLAPSRFLAAMVTRVLAATPVNMHRDARHRRASPRPS